MRISGRRCTRSTPPKLLAVAKNANNGTRDARARRRRRSSRLAEDVDGARDQAERDAAAGGLQRRSRRWRRSRSRRRPPSSTGVSRAKFSVITGLDDTPSPRSAAMARLYAIATHPATLLSTY